MIEGGSREQCHCETTPLPALSHDPTAEVHLALSASPYPIPPSRRDARAIAG
jgi:hypothetical protein